MNAAEKKMVTLLKDLRENHGVIGIKTELEVEGARIDDLFRIKEVTMLAGLPLTLKIGGCEAVSDMALARLVGVGNLVAPMVESPFALGKFVEAAKRVFDKVELQDTNLLVNIETVTAARCFDEMLALPQFAALSGIAIGRKDFAMSMGLGLKNLDDEAIMGPCRDLITKIKAKDDSFLCMVGGIGGADSLNALRTLEGLDAFETRKMIFSAEALKSPNVALGLKKGLEFEVLWYEAKAEYYRGLSEVDDGYLNRIKANIATL